MHKLTTHRFVLPAIAILTVVAIAIVAVALLTYLIPGSTAWNYPG